MYPIITSCAVYAEQGKRVNDILSYPGIEGMFSAWEKITDTFRIRFSWNIGTGDWKIVAVIFPKHLLALKGNPSWVFFTKHAFLSDEFVARSATERPC